MSKADFSEDTLIEQPAIALFGELKWETADCFHEFEQAGGSPLGRETAAEVVLVRRLRAALEKLNPKAPADAIAQAIEEITRDRSRMSPAAANQEVYRLLKDGVRVAGAQGSRGEREQGGIASRTHHGVPVVQEMKVGPSEPLYRRRLQTTLSCCSQKLWW